MDGDFELANMLLTYNIELSVTLPIPSKEDYEFLGWYEDENFSGTPVSVINQGLVGNKVFYSKWQKIAPADPDKIYTITYVLNGGTLDLAVSSGYQNRDQMITDFLTDFYNFLADNGHLNKASVSLNTFMHGEGKTSGYDGLYNDEIYFDHMYLVNDKTIDETKAKFVNQPEFNPKWIPLLDLIDEYASTGNPTQSFWGSIAWGGRVRIKPFIRKQNLWSNEGEEKAALIDEIVNRIPEELKGSVAEQAPNSYKVTSPDIELPKAKKTNDAFLGWYTNDQFEGHPMDKIISGSYGDLTLYARYESTVIPDEENPEPDVVYVSFNLGGASGQPPAQQTLEVGKKVIKPADPVRNGYTFDGWYVGINKFNFNTPVTNNMALVAKWIKDEVEIPVDGFTITYHNVVSFSNRDEMNEALLDDFYDFLVAKNKLNSASVSRNAFKHGAGKSSGFDGLYNNTNYYQYLYQANDKSVDPNKPYFINQPEYNVKWLPLLDLLNEYQRKVQDKEHDVYWAEGPSGSAATIKNFIQGKNLSGLLGRVQNEYAWDKVDYYQINMANDLPLPDLTFNWGFFGWYDNPGFNGAPVTKIPRGSTGNKDYYARWNRFVVNDGEDQTTPGANKQVILAGSQVQGNGFKVMAFKHLGDFMYELLGKGVNYTHPNADLYVSFHNDCTSLYKYNINEIYDNIKPGEQLKRAGIYMWFVNWGDQLVTFKDSDGQELNSYYVQRGDILVKPQDLVKEGYEFLGWYVGNIQYNFDQRVTDDLNLVARWKKEGEEEPTVQYYSIEYVTNGGAFEGYKNKDELAVGLLTDFHRFLGSPGSLSDFIHGSGKSSGYEGTWYNNEDYRNKIYDENTKTGNNEFFASHSSYQHWKPFFEMMEQFVVAVNPEQNFWSSPYTGNMRIKDYFQNEKYTPEIQAMLPEGLTQSVVNEYSIESGDITLPTITRAGYKFEGWYANADFTGTPVTKILSGSTGNKKFYAKWSQPIYTITYNLNGGNFVGYNNKNDLARGFLTDLYIFLGSPGTLNDFMHGAGNTSGFDGSWYHNEDFREQIFGINIRSGNNDYFASHSNYQQKWKPFFDMMEKFVRDVNAEQQFWASNHTGTMRMWQYFRHVKPAPYVSDETMNLMPVGLTASVFYEYNANTPNIVLPAAVRDGHLFEGWFEGNTKVTNIPTGSTGNKVLEARWKKADSELEELMNFFEFHRNPSIRRQNITYYGWQSTSTHTLYPSVHKYLFNDPINVDWSHFVNGWLKSKPNTQHTVGIQWVVLHDTGDNVGTAKSNAGWVSNSGNSGASYHWTVGNDGWFAILPEEEAAWHAGDGSSYSVFHDTGIPAHDPTVRPKLGTVVSGGVRYYTIHGQRTNVRAPGATFPTLGLWPVIINGRYHINDTRMRYSNSSGTLGFDGGNYGGVGIETAVTKNTDVWLTWHRTAKLTADILVRRNLLVDRVAFHNSFDGKACPQTAIRSNNVDNWLQLIYMEYHMRKHFPNHKVEFVSHSPFVNNRGRVVSLPNATTTAEYTITLVSPSGARLSRRMSTQLVV